MQDQRVNQRWEAVLRRGVALAFAGLFPTFCALAAPGAVAGEAAAPCPYTIEDGDTITVTATGERVRLLGFDTPEVGSHAWCEAELRLGERARERLTALLCGPGAQVAIIRDETAPGGRLPAGESPGATKRDRYNRTLARVTLGGTDVAEIMISEGWARAYAGGRRKGWCSRDSRDDLGNRQGAGDG